MLWALVPLVAIFVHGWMLSLIGERGGNLGYALVWLIALTVTVVGHAPVLVWGFCLLIFAVTWSAAPVNRGDMATALHVNPFHTPGIKWGMLAAAVVVLLWRR